MSWTLKGETGETLDATARTLESLRIDAATVQFRALSDDSLTWTAATEDATGTGTIVPRIGQVVELWKDTTRVFRGHAVAPRVGMKQIEITVQGPWWWLERISLTSDQTDATGATAERPTYVFATGSLKTHLETLIDRAITNGAPIRRGTVATMFDVPRMTLAEQSCASALATLMQWCPDAVAWFDYADTTGNALPKLHIGRRGDFSATTLTIGTDAVEIAEITPRLDLEVSRTELAYVTRQAATGKPAWASQTSGTSAAGKRQIIAISGPEITDHLPKDDFASQEIRTSALAITEGEVLKFDGAIRAACDQYGYDIPWYGLGGYNGTIGGRPRLQWSSEWTGQHWVAEGALTEWMAQDGGYIRKTVRIAGWIYGWYSSSYGYGNTLNALMQSGKAAGGYVNGGYYWCLYVDYSVDVINHSWPALTTVYRAWDYDFLNPPAGLAAELLACQNWVPWEGQITTVSDEVSGANLLGAKYNLAGTLTDCATMAALSRGVTHDIMRGRTTIELGAPARTDFGSLVARIRRDPKDNIVYL